MSSFIGGGGGGSSGGLPLAGANLTFYVQPAGGGGSDSNSGTIGSPFLTVKHAVIVAAGFDYQNIYFPTIQLGTPGSPVTLDTQPGVFLPVLTNCFTTNSVGGFGGSIIGDLTTPTNLVYPCGGGNCFTARGTGCEWTIQGIHVTGGGFHALDVTQGAFISPGAIRWDAVFQTVYYCTHAGAIAGTNNIYGTFYDQLGTFWMLLQEGALINFSGESHTFPSTPSLCAFLGVEVEGWGGECMFDGISWGNFNNLQGPKLQVQGGVFITTDHGLLSEIPGFNPSISGANFFNRSTILQGMHSPQHCSQLGPFTNANNLNQQSGATYTLGQSDLGSILEMTNAGANTVTVPLTFFQISHGWPASISGTTMTVSGSGNGNEISVGDIITGTGVSAQTYVVALGTGTGDDGTYTVSPSQTAASFSDGANLRDAPLNARIIVVQAGTGATTVVGDTGVTVHNAGILSAQWSAATLYQRSFTNATSEWVMIPGA